MLGLLQEGGKRSRSARAGPGHGGDPGHHPPHRRRRWHALPARPGQRHAQDRLAGARSSTSTAATTSSRASFWPCSRTATSPPRPPKARAPWTRRNPICAPPPARPFPSRWSRRRPMWTPTRQAMDAAKKVLDSREQLFKEGALARRQVDEALVNYAQAKSPVRSRPGASAGAPGRRQGGTDQDRLRAGGIRQGASSIPRGPAQLCARSSAPSAA